MAGKKRVFPFPAAAALMILGLLAGCDTFSLTDLLSLKGGGGADPLSLTAGATKVPRNDVDPVALTVTGGTPPYDFTVAAIAQYPGTALDPIGYVVNQDYYSEGSIGQMEITVTDDRGESASTTIFVVPQTPSLTVVRPFLSNNIQLAWIYSETDKIDSFLIQKSVDGGPFNNFGSFGNLETEKLDTDAPFVFGRSYSYRIYAVSGGEYFSIPDEQYTF